MSMSRKRIKGTLFPLDLHVKDLPRLFFILDIFHRFTKNKQYYMKVHAVKTMHFSSRWRFNCILLSGFSSNTTELMRLSCYEDGYTVELGKKVNYVFCLKEYKKIFKLTKNRYLNRFVSSICIDGRTWQIDGHQQFITQNNDMFLEGLFKFLWKVVLRLWP